MKALKFVTTVLSVAILVGEGALAAPVYHANSVVAHPVADGVVKRADALADAAAPMGAIDGGLDQIPGVVPVKRDAELIVKSDEHKDCSEPCHQDIHRSIATDNEPFPPHEGPGPVVPIAREVDPSDYLDGDKSPKSKRAVEATSAAAADYYWPLGFKGPRSKRSETTVPLSPVSGGYASGAFKRSETTVPLNLASGGYKSGAPKRSEVILLPTHFAHYGDTKALQTTVPLNPASGGYKSGAPKRADDVAESGGSGTDDEIKRGQVV
ncbi:hypothetical protein MMC08_000830 [Hypocenomyce scalaris]|nr:hypothetical protein [Hypocenomyce scalaris]